jgi:hypothetical protein
MGTFLGVGFSNIIERQNRPLMIGVTPELEGPLCTVHRRVRGATKTSQNARTKVRLVVHVHGTVFGRRLFVVAS